MKILVIIPTYNEKENISQILPAVLKADEAVDILVVDDRSPDGTGAVVQKIAETEKRVHLLSREKKEGLGRAYLAGFNWALKANYEAVVEMDADFSHRPEDLLGLLKDLRAGQDFVIGSRYVEGGATVHWGILRKIISKGGSLYARLILGFPIKDWTGGFNGWSRGTLEKIGLHRIQSNGYSFQIELKYRALRAGCQGREVPIIFEDRRVGQSKMSLKIVLEAFQKVWSFRFS